MDIRRKVNVPKWPLNGVISSSGELVELPIPTANVELNFDEISEEEQTIHSEFFDGRQSKTPDRYLKIRNHIIESWLKSKPVYLNKTSVRKGLKNCGDVNCIGRIHSYLECIGVINFGCEQALYNNLNKTHLLTYKTAENPTVFTTDKADMRLRKRRIRDTTGEWVDLKVFEGKTIENTSRCDLETKPKIMNVSRKSYDPFKLVPCLSFTDEKKAPFKVEFNNIALIVMDVHAHISKTEVIGMLGGIYNENDAQLEIVMAVPCRSMSTCMQCEMDPVSQTQASEEIYSKCLKVVGWYHSHPTFSPNPSIRDIETQIKFQEWFSKLGGGQFVGVIVSPYNRLSTGNESEIQCLTISQDICPQLNCNIPYQFDYQVVYSIWDDDLVNKFQVLAEQYSTCNNQVTLSGLYKQSTGISYLQKMLESIKQYISDAEKKEEILNMTFNIFHEKNTM
ncbi:deubiquitinase MYSM1 isoform X2 [Patella vulgata]|uniref:deubiquitinase MYSM1 isoform X2 n=1 Tax=Patella vulgata TaxID=6465 RepID=UPI00218001D5|nr:deubiquitinase MYSM1 isoform X2 [Patella vulgata]